MTFIYKLNPYPPDVCENGHLMSKTFESYRTKGGDVCIFTCGHFLSYDKDGGHAVQSAILENPLLHAKLMALSVIEPEL